MPESGLAKNCAYVYIVLILPDREWIGLIDSFFSFLMLIVNSHEIF